MSISPVPEAISEARRRAQLASAKSRARNRRLRKLDEAITRLVEEAPPLSPEQRAKLASLLAPAGGDRS